MDTKIICPNCGAQLEVSQLMVVDCPFCGSKFGNPLVRESGNHEIIEKIVPFRTSSAQVMEVVFNEFIRWDKIPQDIFDDLEIVSVEQYYLPMYIFSGRYTADWSCTVVYTRYVNNKSVEDLRPANGTATGYFSKLVLANNGNYLPNGIHKYANVMELTSDINACITKFDASYLIGENGTNINVIQSNLSKDACRNNKLLKEKISDEAYSAAKSQTSGWNTRDFRVSPRWSYNYSELVLMPFWYVRYKYDDQEYFFVLNGADPGFTKCAYTFPEDNTSKLRIWKIVGRGSLMIGLCACMSFFAEDLLKNYSYLFYICLFAIVFLIIRFVLEADKFSEELSSIKLLGKAKFCNEPMPELPDATHNYLRFKRNNQIMTWGLIAIMAILSILGRGFIKKDNVDDSQDIDEITISENVQQSALSSADRTFKPLPNNGVITVNGVTFKMIKVSGGTFEMGSTKGEDEEQPVHSVTLSDYYIGETEVTQELWQAVMGHNPSHFKGNKLPVEKVSWNDCQKFITKLNELTGQNFRLPTEAEWEFAAKGGTQSKGYTYSGSNSLGDVGWYCDNSSSNISDNDSVNDVSWNDDATSNKTHEVATKAPNELGIFDMSGNVCEWCHDWWDYYSSSRQTNPAGSSSGPGRVLRGGSWFYVAANCRTARRYSSSPSSSSWYYGFRLAH